MGIGRLHGCRPSYPYTSPPAPLDEADILNHPAELRSLIAALTVGLHSTGAPLHGLANKGEVGVAGQSDGGDVSLATAYNTCCYDPAVKAVAVLSGAELPSFGGTYFAGPQVPLLVVQGTADTVNPPGCSAQLYDEAKAPKIVPRQLPERRPVFSSHLVHSPHALRAK